MKRFRTLIVWMVCLLTGGNAIGQTENSVQAEEIQVDYQRPREYEIADITFSGVKDQEEYLLVGLSGLYVGQIVSIPGKEITGAARRFWKNGLYSDVSVTVTKTEGNKVFLNIALKQRPRISNLEFNGVKKSDRKELESKLGMIKGNQITPNIVDRARTVIQRYFDEKGYKNAEIEILQQTDVTDENQVMVTINVDKKTKVKVHRIYLEGVHAMNPSKVKRTMKKTNEKGKFSNLFRTKKFITENYENDKSLIIERYNELGYRDARIVSDSIAKFDDKTVDVYINIEEGQRYFLRHIEWVGNKLYPTELLNTSLRMKPGDVYNQKMLEGRLNSDEDAIAAEYSNNGYLWITIRPMEVNIDGDSIDLELQVYEGPQATINQVIINGNDRVYENVIRRELYVKPGQLYNRDALIRSVRELAQMGHFDPEQIMPVPIPNPNNGTVDIDWTLVPKGSDQIEFSAGWGQTGLIGRISLRFTNFSIANLLRPSKNKRGFLPQGDGQTLTLSGQTNASYYQSYSISFYDPWFGGKRPNAFSVSAFYSKQTDVSNLYYNSSYYDNYYNSLYNGYYGYGSYNGYNNTYENYYDPDKSVQMYGVSVGWGKRLRWPDNFFQFYSDVSLNRYILKNWAYFPVTNGNCNNFSITLRLSRNSVDNPIFPRKGSDISGSVQLTPPYSLWDGKDYSSYDKQNQEDYNSMFKWIEYHKWKFKAKTYTPLTSGKRNLVLMTRTEFGFVGSYNKDKGSPFETFMMGGDGMSGYSTYGTENIPLRGYENNSLTPNSYYYGHAYTRLGLELRFPLMLEASTTIYALGFLEAGNSWAKSGDFNPFDLKRSAGFGLRIMLPMVGLMGVDWGYGFDKVFGSSQYGGSHFHFVLGQEF